MKTVYLLRHAKAENASGNQEDIERKLSAVGREACTVMGTYMKKEKYKPAFVLCSPANRTQETFGLVMQAAGMEPEYKLEKKLYMSSTDQVIGLLHRLDDQLESAMVVGHNPVMHHLAVTLAKPMESKQRTALLQKYPTGTLTVLRFAVDSWMEVAPQEGTLFDFVSPSDS